MMKSALTTRQRSLWGQAKSTVPPLKRDSWGHKVDIKLLPSTLHTIRANTCHKNSQLSSTLTHTNMSSPNNNASFTLENLFGMKGKGKCHAKVLQNLETPIHLAND